jgi:hypothetical protein
VVSIICRPPNYSLGVATARRAIAVPASVGQAWRFSISPIGLWLGRDWVQQGLHQPAPIPDQAQAVAG